MGNVSFVMDLGFTPALPQSPNDNSFLLISDQIPPGRFNSLSDRVADYLQWLPRPIFWRPGQVIDDKDNHSYDCEEEDGGFVDGEEDNVVPIWFFGVWPPKQYIWGIYRSEQGRQTLFTARHRGAADAVKS